MKVLAVFAALLAYTLCVGALISYPVYEFIQAFFSEDSFLGRQAFGKVANRCFMLAALSGLYPAWKAMGCSSKEDLGYGTPKTEFTRQMKRGLLFGIASMLVLSVFIISLGIRPFEHDASIGEALRILPKVIAGAIAIGFLEETFFRGILLRSMARSIRPAGAIIVTSLVFASIHFIRNKTDGQLEDLHWLSGFVYLKGSFASYSDPAVIGSWLTLFTCGVFLSFLSLHHGHIGSAIGVHCGWVVILGITKKLTDDDPSSPLIWMIGSYDKITGYLAFAILTVICTAFYFFTRKKGPAKEG
jgi:membrane protease YdiL (CAAX protease family)